MKGPFDVIFCRNVVIYFHEDTQRRLWPRFQAALVPGGTLCVGHSERIPPMPGLRLKSVGVTAYQREAVEFPPNLLGQKAKGPSDGP